MSIFIKRILMFTLIPVIFIILGFIFMVYISKSIDYRIDNQVENIFIGDSHIQCAINDDLLRNSKNVSTNSESYYFSYYKLKKLLEENKQIKKVFLGAGYHNLSNYYDDFIDGEYSLSVSPKYFYLLPFEEQMNLMRWNYSNLSIFLKKVFTLSFRYLLNKNFDYGGYKNDFIRVSANQKSMDKRLNYQFYKDGKLNQFSETNLKYLNMIVNLCLQYKVELILLNTPLHPYFRNKIPGAYVMKFKEIVDSNKFKLMDFEQIKFNDNCFIPDGDHLSGEGVKQFAKIFISAKNMK